MTIIYKDNVRGCNHPLDADCEKCRYDGSTIEHFAAPKSLMFRPAFYEHVSLEGVQCDTPQQLYDACASRGLTSQYIADFGSTFRVEKDRARDQFAKREERERAAQRHQENYG